MSMSIRLADPLAERQRLITFWKLCAETNRQYLPCSGCWAETFYRNPSFSRLATPTVRELIEERDRTKKAEYESALMESSRQFIKKKAERVAAKHPQQQMFEVTP